MIEAIELGPQWLEEVLAIISMKDEVEQVKKKRQAAQEKLRRMAKAYIDGVLNDIEYSRQKKLLEMEFYYSARGNQVLGLLRLLL